MSGSVGTQGETGRVTEQKQGGDGMNEASWSEIMAAYKDSRNTDESEN